MSTIPYDARPRTTPHRRPYTPAALDAYAQAHGNTAAAQHFGIDERSVRRVRAKVQPVPIGNVRNVDSNSSTIGETPKHSNPQMPIPGSAPAPSLPHYATVNVSAVADSDCLWKCPHCGDWMHPVPKTTGEEWAREGCYQCSTRHAAPMSNWTPPPANHEELPDDYVMQPDRTANHDAAMPVRTGGQESTDSPLGSHETAGHARTDDVVTAPVLTGPVHLPMHDRRPTGYQPRPQKQRLHWTRGDVSAASYNPIATDGEVLWVVARAAIFVALVVLAISAFS